MNYPALTSGFDLKKVLQYTRLYGWRRTYEIVSERKHLIRKYTSLPSQIGNMRTRHSVGIIGCGNHAYSVIAYYLHKEFRDIIAACMDKDINRAASLAAKYKVPLYTENLDDLLQCKNIELIYIASNNASHAEHAIRALEYGKDVFVEAPHVVSIDQLHRLHKAILASQGKIFLGFNRPYSRFGRLIAQRYREISGQAVMNWFIVGDSSGQGLEFDNPDEGGPILRSLCHSADHALLLAPDMRFPITIIPAKCENNDQDYGVNLIFADGSIASVTLANQGNLCDGTRESFRAHKGNLIISMDDFQKMTIETGGDKKVYRNFRREYGHEAAIINAYRNVRYNEAYYRTEEVSHILNSGWLFLNIREALEKNTQLIIRSYEDEFANIYSANTQKESAGLVFEKVSK